MLFYQNYVNQGKAILSYQNVKRKGQDFPLGHWVVLYPAWAPARFDKLRRNREGGDGRGSCLPWNSETCRRKRQEFLNTSGQSSQYCWRVASGADTTVGSVQWMTAAVVPSRERSSQGFRSGVPFMLMGISANTWEPSHRGSWKPLVAERRLHTERVPCMSGKKQEPVKCGLEASFHLCSQGVGLEETQGNFLPSLPLLLKSLLCFSITIFII